MEAIERESNRLGVRKVAQGARFAALARQAWRHRHVEVGQPARQRRECGMQGEDCRRTNGDGARIKYPWL